MSNSMEAGVGAERLDKCSEKSPEALAEASPC
jgi:hypothetical protein